jgi:hypothetical protein
MLAAEQSAPAGGQVLHGPLDTGTEDGGQEMGCGEQKEARNVLPVGGARAAKNH